MNENFAITKRYYERGFWDEDKLRALVAKNWITAAEFQTITGHGILDK